MTAAVSCVPTQTATDHVRVREAQADDAAAWDAFVQNCPDATFLHRYAWKGIFERSFGHRMYYLCAEDDHGAMIGVLPLGHVRSRMFGNALISVPFLVYGGAAANTDRARQALEAAAEELAVQMQVDYLELRNLRSTQPEWLKKDLYVTFRKEMDPDPEVNLTRIPRKQRAMVRKGIQAGLTSEIDQTTDRFYFAYSSSVRNLGTPVFSRRYFEQIKQAFGDDCQILTITKDGRAVSSVMSFVFRDEILPYFGGGTGEARALKANDFMYWEVMRRSCEAGIRVFDYGRSKQGTGSYSFKKNWGFEPQPLPYQYRLVKASELPDINPLNPKYRLFVQMWQRLPLWLANRLGPMISRNLG